MATHRYHVVPFIGRINSNKAETAQTVAAQLQTLIDHYASHGWDFYSVEKVGIEINPGCLGALLGHSVTYINYDQVVFRRPS